MFLNVDYFLVLPNVIEIEYSQDIFYWRRKITEHPLLLKKVSLVNVSHLNLLACVCVCVSVLSLTCASEFKFHVDILKDFPIAIILY